MNIVFNSDFLEDIEKLGNSVKLIKYYLEDYSNSNEGYTLKDIIDINNGYSPKTYYGQGSNDDTFVRGIWDKDRKEFITHLSLPDSVIANVVRYNENTGEPIELEYEYVDSVSGKKAGNNLIRIIRFVYSEKMEDSTRYKTAFLVTGDISGNRRNYTIDPIRINQDRNIIIVSFPENTKANIIPYTVEKDTKFLENYGIDPGINIFLNSDEESLVSRDSFYKYLRVYTGDLQNFQTPYIDSSGKEIKRNYIYRDYKKLNIDCAGLFKNSTPNTKPKLSRYGGKINIYGSAEYDEYILLGDELKYMGKGEEPINNIPNVDIEFSGSGTLRDVKLDTDTVVVDEDLQTEFNTEVNKFRISYGRYEDQEDPSKLVNFKLRFYDPILDITKEVKSKKIKITQLEEVLNEWEVFDRTTEYFENSNPVYIFPWKAIESGQRQHSFKIRTCLSNLNITDFILTYENEILNELFKCEISFEREYPYYIYTVTLINKTTNEDAARWLPILNGESTILLTTLRLNGYEDYVENFYMVQRPMAEKIELHENPNNSNVNSIVFDTNETEKIYYPVAPEARDNGDIGVRNTWKVFSSDENVIVTPVFDKLNPNNVGNLNYGLRVTIERQSESIESINFDDLVIGRIKENETDITLNERNWRNIIGLSTISIPVSKSGLSTQLVVPEELIFREINLYTVRIQTNSSVSCQLTYENGYEEKFSFFDPYNNRIVGGDSFYNRDPSVPIYIALTDLSVITDELIPVGRLDITVSGENRAGESSITKSCIIYQGPHEARLEYISNDTSYVFLDSDVRFPVKYISTRTPERYIERLSNVNVGLIPYNDIIISNSTPNVEIGLDGYHYHSDYLQNPNSLSGFYPISPAAIFSVYQSYYDLKKNFYIFRKALGPSLISDDPNTVYVSSSTTDEPITIVIRSRYRINSEDFIKNITNPNIDFTVHADLEELLENDYYYKYTIEFSPQLDNSGPSRLLGTLVINSRVYKGSFISTNTANVDNIPYYEFSQEEVDRIIPPYSYTIAVYQLGTGSNNANIRISGNTAYEVDVNGENRVFGITSDVQINNPVFTNINNCYILDESNSGFTIKIPSIYDTFSPCDPRDYSEYSDITSGRDINVDVSILPVDQSYEEYHQSLHFHQSPVENGIILGSSQTSPTLFIGNNNYTVVETVSGSEDEFSSFLGLFSINGGITDGETGSLYELEITSGDRNNYTIISNTVNWYENLRDRPNNIKFRFSINDTDQTIDRTYTISYKLGNVIIHKVTLIIKQQSLSGSFNCDNNMYVLSHGECLNQDVNDIGWFDFETNIPRQQLSVSLSSDLLDQIPTIQEKGLGSYKIFIKLKPNLTEAIRTTVLNFIRNGTDIVKSVSVSQGYYCTKLYYPSSDEYVINNGSIGSTSNYIDTPTRNDEQIGTRKLFKISIMRCEPVLGGEWVYNADLAENVDLIVSNYTWGLLGVTRASSSPENNTITRNSMTSERETISDYLSNYNTSIIFGRTQFSNRIPYLKNQYTVNNLYYGYSVKNRVTVSLTIFYPTGDILDGYYITPTFNIFQNKLGET